MLPEREFSFPKDLLGNPGAFPPPGGGNRAIRFNLLAPPKVFPLLSLAHQEQPKAVYWLMRRRISP
jgi:hypothetical protein